MLSNGFAGGMDTPLEVPGAAPQGSPAMVQFCSEEVIETLGLRLIAGRPMSALEVTSAHKVALVSQKLVSVYFNGEDPIGRTVRVPRVATLKDALPDPTFTIVGVVSDVANRGPQQPSAPQIYIPNTIRKSAGYTIVVRTQGDPLAITSAVRRQVSAIDRQIALWPPLSATQMLDRGVYAQPRFSLIVLGMFGVTGVLLVALGVYGVLAYTVSQRSQEIAIRMALGGERGHVLRLVFRMGLRLVGVGLVVGFAASLATNRLLVNQLWQISPHDPITLAAAVGVVLTIGVCACWVPARRAIRVEPIAALRHE
jgi:ABC-type antimicrobial peptide transport system permease subunit